MSLYTKKTYIQKSELGTLLFAYQNVWFYGTTIRIGQELNNFLRHIDGPGKSFSPVAPPLIAPLKSLIIRKNEIQSRISSALYWPFKSAVNFFLQFQTTNI